MEREKPEMDYYVISTTYENEEARQSNLPTTSDAYLVFSQDEKYIGSGKEKHEALDSAFVKFMKGKGIEGIVTDSQNRRIIDPKNNQVYQIFDPMKNYSTSESIEAMLEGIYHLQDKKIEKQPYLEAA